MERFTFPDLERHRGKLLIFTGIRIIFFSAILVLSLIYQIKQTLFFNTESLFPLYFVLFLAFILNSAYLYFFDTIHNLAPPTAALFAFDVIAISVLVLVTGGNQSMFMLLYLVNVILCSLIFQRKGAFWVAVFTSVCFSAVLILGPELQGQTLYFTVGLNNLAFFIAAGLTGYLSEQLNLMGQEIDVRRKDIRALQDFNKVIIEGMSSGLITVNLQGNIIFCNRSATSILEKNLLGESLGYVFGDSEHLIRDMSSDPETRLQFTYQKPNGDIRHLGFVVSPLKDHRGDLNGHILMFQDVTEIVRMEETLRRQEKLAAVGQLAAGIAHEIRNPLASISGSVELLKGSIPSPSAEQNKLVNIALREISRLNQLISEVLDFVRVEERRKDQVSLDGLLDDILEVTLLNANLPKVTQVRDLRSDAIVLGDRNKLQQVFLNLIINAYQAMADCNEKLLTVSTRFENGTAVVSVRDTGAGMPPEVRKRLFEPFFTTKAKGTGLGLAVAHKILENHSADIFVESHEDKGTEFTIRFNEAIKQGATSNEGQNTGS